MIKEINNKEKIFKIQKKESDLLQTLKNSIRMCVGIIFTMHHPKGFALPPSV
jgi:hypothetical protein|tara:strand:- start:414 stop:569 length:156 start_codon:yes stop_codon:yes gene_type:complete